MHAPEPPIRSVLNGKSFGCCPVNANVRRVEVQVLSDQCDNMDAAATALVQFAQQRGVDLIPYCRSAQFLNEANGRYIRLWIKKVEFGYALQGKVLLLPREFAESTNAFRNMWHEAGTLPDIERAFEFVAAWLLDGTEIDQLPVPKRERRRYGIG